MCGMHPGKLSNYQVVQVVNTLIEHVNQTHFI